MRQKKTFRAGNVEIDIKGNGQKALDNLLKLVTPDSAKIIEREMEKIKSNAENEWLVRQPNKKGQPTTKGSKNKIYIGKKINKDAEIVFFLGNSAPYAWAIKVGVESDTNLPRGRRIANELLVKPTKKATTIMLEAIAKDLSKKV